MGLYILESEERDYYIPRVFSDHPDGYPRVEMPSELFLRWKRAMRAVEKIEEEIDDLMANPRCACNHGCLSRINHKGQFSCWYRTPEEERW
jgi:hypothetical protein